jgi:hypothetical protein
VIHTIAGNGTAGFNGDGIPATPAQLSYPSSIVVDNSGNVYISDVTNSRIREINNAGIISTYAGNGTVGFSGDGGPATAAALTLPTYWLGAMSLALDKRGNMFIADGFRIRKVNAAGVITTVGGTGIGGYSGDGGPATDAQIQLAEGIAVDDTGNVYLAETNNNIIRKIDTSGVIHTVVANNIPGFSGDGGPALLAEINHPEDVLLDLSNDMYIADFNNNRIRFVCGRDSIVASAAISSSPGDTICDGSTVTFTVTLSNTGSEPSYQWVKNGSPITGATASTYTAGTLDSADVITCIVANSNPIPCATAAVVTSNAVTMVVRSIPPSPSGVALVASPGAVTYTGEPVTYTASYTNGGPDPVFQW